eukprot:evm.model.scf_339EXC.12 EVM.evm.TU.scf_339EXC.12   scf_339EXC:65214-74400(-)
MRLAVNQAGCLAALFLCAAAVGATTHRCKLLASRLAEACPLLERLGESEGGGHNGAAGGGGVDFGPDCCQALARFNDSGCLCNNAVRESLLKDFDLHRFAPALAAAARAAPEGCGLNIYAAYGRADCGPIGGLPYHGAAAGEKAATYGRAAERSFASARKLQNKGACKKGDHIFKVLEGFEQAFGKLLDSVSAQKEVAKLLNGDGPITMFTPIGTEIQVEVEVDGETVVEDVDTTLRRHILLGNYPTKKLTPGQTFTAENGETLEITEESGELRVNGIPIVQRDIKACNGWIHVVGKPLSPLATGQSSAAEKEQAPTPASPSPGNAAAPLKRPPARNSTPPPSSANSGGSGNSGADPCKCSEDGVIDGQNTKRPGCAQHLLEAENNLLFCYVEDAQGCAATGAFELAESGGFKDVSWRNCTIEEAGDLPSVGKLMSDEVTAFEPAWESLFNHGDLPDMLMGDGPFTVLVPSKAAIDTAAIGDKESRVQALAKKHIIADDLSMEALLAKSGTKGATITSLDGVPLAISMEADGSISIGEGVHIQLSDVVGANGVVHLVDKVVEEENEGTSPTLPEPPASLPQPTLPSPVPASTPPPALPKPSLPKPTLPTPALQEPTLSPPSNATAVGGASPSALTPPLAGATGNELGTARPVGAGGLVKGRKTGNPCACSKDGISGRVNTGRPGCKRHIKGERLFCYVQDPDKCPFGAPSEEFPGAKVVVCADPCACSKTGISGTVDTKLKGCDKHVKGQPELCYVEKPDECTEGFKSERYAGTRWRYCPEEAPKSKPKPKQDNRDPCECSNDGKSGDVYTGQKGCGQYGAFGVGYICWVVKPTECIVGIGSLRFPGAAWRPC